jgi:gamma-glutamyltranspeptidase/glutathione hydrolase
MNMRLMRLPRPVVIKLLNSVFVLALSLNASLSIAETPSASAVASAHPLATQAGIEILKTGGNAFDAAVAITAMLAVVEPYGSGLGGGGLWLLHDNRKNKEIMIDGRETAPAAASRDMYLNAKGEVVENLSVNGPLAAAIPGVPAALVHIAQKYGQLPLAATLAPAIKVAKEGFAVDERYRRLAQMRKNVLNRYPSSAQIFLVNGEAPPPGHIIVQTDLAKTLTAIAQKGNDGFYRGSVAQSIVEEIQKSGGNWSMNDLASYRVVEREPIRTVYKGIKITTASPPSSGGIALVDALNILSAYDLEKMPLATQKHAVVEAMRRAYRDRALYLGDPDFVDIPVSLLTSPVYAAGQRTTLHLDKATPSNTLTGINAIKEGFHTTHFSILDQERNSVAATVTINVPFGSAYVVQGTGVLLNDEMDDFSVKPGVPNAYSLVGAEANSIAPNKRPLSSMSPTLLDGPQGMAVLGTPGGSRIISMVLLGILDYARGNKPDSWVSQKRFHHQYLPDKIQYETGAFDDDVRAELQFMGHELDEVKGPYGNMQAILWDVKNNKVFAASDPRGVGSSIVLDVKK